MRHVVFGRLMDTNLDGKISRDEFDASVIALLIAPDIQLFDGGHYAPQALPKTKDSFSVAFRVHLSPCPAGHCTSAAPADACRDRVRDGTETDVDCGGTCQPCQAGASCAAPNDCQTNACDTGRCRAPSCTDGMRDGFESDVDCGDNCAKCPPGRACVAGSDCASGTCNNSPGSLGTCTM
jgi:hypothetical protein